MCTFCAMINSGEISLRPVDRNFLGGSLVKGNVYFDNKPVCDDGFGDEEATVVCRSVCFHLSQDNLLLRREPRRLGSSHSAQTSLQKRIPKILEKVYTVCD